MGYGDGCRQRCPAYPRAVVGVVFSDVGEERTAPGVEGAIVLVTISMACRSLLIE